MIMEHVAYAWLAGWLVFCCTLIILRMLDNRRQVTRHVLHGTVTYTIKGYDGPRAVEIAQSLENGSPADSPVPVTTVEK